MSYVFSKALRETTDDKERRKTLPPKWGPHYQVAPPVAKKPGVSGASEACNAKEVPSASDRIQHEVPARRPDGESDVLKALRKTSLPQRSSSVDSQECDATPKMGGAFARLQFQLEHGEDTKAGLYSEVYEAYKAQKSLKEHGVLPSAQRERLRKFSLDKEVPPVVLPKPRNSSAESKRDVFGRNRSLTTPASPTEIVYDNPTQHSKIEEKAELPDVFEAEVIKPGHNTETTQLFSEVKPSEEANNQAIAHPCIESNTFDEINRQPATQIPQQQKNGFGDPEEINRLEHTPEVLAMKQEIAENRTKNEEGKRHLSDAIDELENIDFGLSEKGPVSFPPVEEHANVPPVEEHANVPPVEELINVPPVEEHVNVPIVEESVNAPPVEENINGESFESALNEAHRFNVTGEGVEKKISIVDETSEKALDIQSTDTQSTEVETKQAGATACVLSAQEVPNKAPDRQLEGEKESENKELNEEVVETVSADVASAPVEEEDFLCTSAEDPLQKLQVDRKGDEHESLSALSVSKQNEVTSTDKHIPPEIDMTEPANPDMIENPVEQFQEQEHELQIVKEKPENISDHMPQDQIVRGEAPQGDQDTVASTIPQPVEELVKEDKKVGDEFQTTNKCDQNEQNPDTEQVYFLSQSESEKEFFSQNIATAGESSIQLPTEKSDAGSQKSEEVLQTPANKEELQTCEVKSDTQSSSEHISEDTFQTNTPPLQEDNTMAAQNKDEASIQSVTSITENAEGQRLQLPNETRNEQNDSKEQQQQQQQQLQQVIVEQTETMEVHKNTEQPQQVTSEQAKTEGNSSMEQHPVESIIETQGCHDKSPELDANGNVKLPLELDANDNVKLPSETAV